VRNGRPKSELALTQIEQDQLLSLARRATTAQRTALRAKIGAGLRAEQRQSNRPPRIARGPGHRRQMARSICHEPS